ncbi:hypothetical protein CIK05_08535 [Bdellovibrio sp. qaytius]|nr:hypothetical protein CIK05_08535 [Bdellovibrio sp. qaytius]
MMNMILKKINAMLVTMSLATMVFSPVALGKQAQANQEQMSKAQLEQIVQTLGLNKSMTFGEFYAKNKGYYPPRVQKMVEQLVSKFKDEPMPQFVVGSTQNSQGETVATLRVNGKDQLSNIQFLGEPAKFAKFDNTNLTQEDIANFDDMFAKLYMGDASHRKGYEGNPLTSPKTISKTTAKTVAPTTFAGMPKITQDMWKKMTPMQRAQFMMNMRMLWSGAQDVIDAKATGKKGKKTSSLEGGTASPLQKWNMFFSMLDEANASDTKCVVAGYIGSYGAGKRCNYPEGAKVAGCSFPCNPTIYGFDSSGKQFCLGSSSELQTATHYNKGCDAKMPLTSVELSLPAKASGKDASRYQGILEANKAQALKDPSAMANTKKYLDSMLNGTPDLKDAFQKGNITAALLAKLQEIQSQFDSTITAARNDCAAAAGETQYDREFWGACDQLHKRFLFVAAYLEKNPGCKGGGKVDEGTLTCACPAGPGVAPGSACAAAPTPAPTPTPGGSSETAVTPPPAPSSGGQCDPSCSGKEICQKTAGDSDGAEVWECKAPGGDKDDNKPGFFSKLWSGVKKVAPWVIGGVALYAAWKIFFQVKKPKLNPAADACPNGNVPPCGQTCAAPQAMLSSGTCGCPACPPGQTMTNASSCLCENTTVSTTQYVCADGVTTVTALANCPSTASYTCWDGSTQPSAISCPEQPATGTGTGTGTSTKTGTSR